MEIPYVVHPRKDTGLTNSKIAIWLFLASEVMLFGGFFSAYIFLRLGADYPWPERTLPVLPGLINTFILIASSVTVVFAWVSLKLRQWRRFQVFMGITVACAAVFMVLKGIEYNVKWHHAAARLNDYTVLEGHLGYEHKPAGGDHDADHKDREYLKDVHGDKIEANRHRFEAVQIGFNLDRYYEPWVEKMMLKAQAAGIEITLAKTYDMNRSDADEPNREWIVKEGTPLSFETLAKMQSIYRHNLAFNQKWRTKFLRQAWNEQWEKVDREDLLGEVAFLNDFPKAGEMDPDERDKTYRRWKAGMRKRMATGVNLTEVSLEYEGEQVQFADIELPQERTGTFVCSEPLLVRFKSHDVVSDYAPAGEQMTLRDDTSLEGKYAASPMVFHNVDGIDFQHLVMDAEKKNQDPMIAIENSWLMQEYPIVAELWEKHQKAVGQLEQILKKEGREPTEVDRYRMNWQNIAYYMETDLVDVKIEEGTVSPPKVTMTAKEHFMGPDYEVRKFPEIQVPREKILLDSKFTPKWNTYYAIYFAITGLHGLHVIGGALVLAYYLFFGRKMYLTNPEWLTNRVEIGGLFWHFVDLIWIFAFPIFYLM